MNPNTEEILKQIAIAAFKIAKNGVASWLRSRWRVIAYQAPRRLEIMRWVEITRHDNDPYLQRLVVFKCDRFGIYLHWFVGSDDECLHDHPWSFVAIILRGGYWEINDAGKRAWFRPGSVLRRPEWFRHRIELKPGVKTVSLVIVGRKVRNWGFYTKFGWLPWQQYRYSEHCS